MPNLSIITKATSEMYVASQELQMLSMMYRASSDANIDNEEKYDIYKV